MSIPQFQFMTLMSGWSRSQKQARFVSPSPTWGGGRFEMETSHLNQPWRIWIRNYGVGFRPRRMMDGPRFLVFE